MHLGVASLMMASFSSLVYRSGMSPDARRSLRYTSTRSSVIWPSVKRNIVGSPAMPARWYMACRSLRKSLMPYVEEIAICRTVSWPMNAARRESDCLPDPPTPTSMACPPEFMTMRTMRHTC